MLPAFWMSRRASVMMVDLHSDENLMLSVFLPLRKISWNSRAAPGVCGGPPADVGAGVSPTMSEIFQVLVVSIELGLNVEKASWERVKTRRYFPFQECFVTRYELAWSGQTELIPDIRIFSRVFEICQKWEKPCYWPHIRGWGKNQYQLFQVVFTSTQMIEFRFLCFALFTDNLHFLSTICTLIRNLDDKMSSLRKASPILLLLMSRK